MTHEPRGRPIWTIRIGAIALGAALVASACGAADEAATTTAPTSSTVTTAGDGAQPDPSTTVAPDDGTGTTLAPDPGSSLTLAPNNDLAGIVDPALATLTQRAVADLSARLNVADEAITVVRAESVVWPDSSYGCPQPGMNYLQVLSDGYWIVLVHSDTAYEYRGGGSLDVTLCEAAIKPNPVGGTGGGGDS